MIWFVLSACSTEFDVVDYTPDEEPAICEITVSSDPVATSADHDARDPIVFTLSAPDPTARVEAPVSGETELYDDNLTLVFTPDAPLEPDTDYSFALAYCGGTAVLDFRTSSLGLPIEGGSGSLVDRAWTVDLYDGEYPEGGSLMAIVASLLTDHLMIGVQEVYTDELQLSIAAAHRHQPEAQNLCMRTVDVAVDFDEPHFEVAFESLEFPAFGLELTLWDILARGSFTPDGERIEAIEVVGVTDVRELMSLLSLDDPEDFDAACDFAQYLEMECGPCLDDGAPYCLDVWGSDFVGREVAEPVQSLTRLPEECG